MDTPTKADRKGGATAAVAAAGAASRPATAVYSPSSTRGLAGSRPQSAPWYPPSHTTSDTDLARTPTSSAFQPSSVPTYFNYLEYASQPPQGALQVWRPLRVEVN